MSHPALLDVNVLVALFDPDHPHHEVAHDWFADNHAEGWATCPITENGLVRVLSNPTYGNPIRPPDLIPRLKRFCQSEHHHFWWHDVSIHDETIFNHALIGSRHVTDIYLLGLARQHGGYLATFDRTIPLKAVVAAQSSHLAVVASVDYQGPIPPA